MEQTGSKQSIVSRLFGFGRKKGAPEEEAGEAEEAGFARTDDESDDVHVPEQVIKIRTSPVRKKDEAIHAIGESFRELTSLLGSVSDRLDRQDSRGVDLAEQLKELPDYLQTLPRLHEEQNRALRSLGESVSGAGQALHAISEHVTEGTEAVHSVAAAMTRIPEEMREHAQAQEEAIRKVATAQHQTAKVLHHGHQKSLQLFHQATQKTLQTVQKSSRRQQKQMQEILAASVSNMKRMFILAAAFMGAALIGIVGLLMFR